MFSKLIILVMVLSCEVEWIHCGNATVPYQVCERYVTIRIYHKELNFTTLNFTVDDSVFKDAGFMLSLLRQQHDFIMSDCNKPIVEVKVNRTVDRQNAVIDTYYQVSVAIKRGYPFNRSVLPNVDNCHDVIDRSIDYHALTMNFAVNISGDIFKADYDTNVPKQSNTECYANPCPARSEIVNEMCVCSPGTYLVVNLKTCTPCPKDTYQEMTGMFNCTPCGGGNTTMNRTGSWNSTSCKSDVHTNPPQCDIGQYLNKISQTCLPCPKNKYQNKPGSTSCEQCPSGLVTSKSGASDVSSCTEEADTGDNALAIALAISAFAVVVVAGILLFYLWRRRKRKEITDAEFMKRFVIVENPDYRYVTPTHSSDEETEDEVPSTTLGYLARDVENRNLEIPRDGMTLTGVRLGRGNFGEVQQVLVRGTDERSEMLCAAKMARGSNSRVLLEDMLDELEIHLKLEAQHENVVNLIGVCSGAEGPFYLILEYCDNGSLIEYLRSHEEIPEYVNTEMREPLSLDWKLSRTLEICNGMKYLASHKIVHRDLAARNVLLDSNTVAKISDFGMAKDVYLKSYYKQRHEGSFPLRWMAIDAIQNLDFTEKTDVWSFGVLIWEVFTDGKLPYYNIIDDQKVAHYILNGKKLKRPENCPKYLYHIMLKCWSNKSFNRPKFWELYDNLKQSIPHHSKKRSMQRRVSQDMLRKFSNTKRSLQRKMSRKGSRKSIGSMEPATNSRKPSQGSFGLELENLHEVQNAIFNTAAEAETEKVNPALKKKNGLLRKEDENINSKKSKKDVLELDIGGTNDAQVQNLDVENDTVKSQCSANEETTCNPFNTNKLKNDVGNLESNNNSAKELNPALNLETNGDKPANLKQDGITGNRLDTEITVKDTHIGSPEDLGKDSRDSVDMAHDMLGEDNVSTSESENLQPFSHQHNNNKDLEKSLNTKNNGPDEESGTTFTVDDRSSETSDKDSTHSVQESPETDRNPAENTTANDHSTANDKICLTTDLDDSDNDLNEALGDTSDTTSEDNASDKETTSEKMDKDTFPKRNLSNNEEAIDYTKRNEENNTVEGGLNDVALNDFESSSVKDETKDGQESSDDSDFLSDVLNAANVFPCDDSDSAQNKPDEEDTANSSSC